jgi:uncharacterized membrane protein YcaP (DUF421 family)
MEEALSALFRSVVTFVSLLIFSRILGKTQISQFTFFEYITGISIGSIAGRLSSDLAGRPWPILVALMAWVTMALGMQSAVVGHRWFARMVDGEPVVVIQNGQVLEGNLKLLRLRTDDLSSMLRVQGIFDLSKVEFAVLEPHGELSVLKRSQHRAVTPADLQLPTKYEGMGVELVVDGQIVEQNLRDLHLNRAWLRERLREQGAGEPGEVFLAILDTQGRLYVDRYQDATPASVNISDYPGPN